MTDRPWTPGPWRARKLIAGRVHWWVEGGRSPHPLLLVPNEPDAHLIAAAPELYAALERALPYLDKSPFENSMVVYEMARRALAKADGEVTP